MSQSPDSDSDSDSDHQSGSFESIYHSSYVSDSNCLNSAIGISPSSVQAPANMNQSPESNSNSDSDSGYQSGSSASVYRTPHESDVDDLDSVVETSLSSSPEDQHNQVEVVQVGAPQAGSPVSPTQVTNVDSGYTSSDPADVQSSSSQGLSHCSAHCPPFSHPPSISPPRSPSPSAPSSPANDIPTQTAWVPEPVVVPGPSSFPSIPPPPGPTPPPAVFPPNPPPGSPSSTSSLTPGDDVIKRRAWCPIPFKVIEDERTLRYGHETRAQLSHVDFGYNLTCIDMRGAWTTERFPDHTQFWCERAAKFGTHAKLTPAEVRELDRMFISEDVDMRGAWTVRKFVDHNHDGESFNANVLRRGTRAVLLNPAEVAEIDYAHPDTVEMEDAPACWTTIPMFAWSAGQPRPLIQSVNSWPCSQPQSLPSNSTTWTLSTGSVPFITSMDWQDDAGHYSGPSPCCCNSCYDSMDWQYEATENAKVFHGWGTRPESPGREEGTKFDHLLQKWRKGNITGDTFEEVNDQVNALTYMVETIDPDLERQRREEQQRHKNQTKILVVGVGNNKKEKDVRFTQNTGPNSGVQFANNGNGNKGKGKYNKNNNSNNNWNDNRNGRGNGNSNDSNNNNRKGNGKKSNNNNHNNSHNNHSQNQNQTNNHNHNQNQNNKRNYKGKGGRGNN